MRGESLKFLFPVALAFVLLLGGCKEKTDISQDLAEQQKASMDSATPVLAQTTEGTPVDMDDESLKIDSAEKQKSNGESEESEEFIRKVAERAQIEEWFIWGVKYHEGNGVELDRSKAKEYFEKAAEKGHHRALFNLGVYYVTGEGGAKDITKGVECFEKAAAEGNEDALFNLAVHYAKGIGVDVDVEKGSGVHAKGGRTGHPRSSL